MTILRQTYDIIDLKTRNLTLKSMKQEQSIAFFPVIWNVLDCLKFTFFSIKRTSLPGESHGSCSTDFLRPKSNSDRLWILYHKIFVCFFLPRSLKAAIIHPNIFDQQICLRPQKQTTLSTFQKSDKRHFFSDTMGHL